MSRRGPQPNFISKSKFDILGDDIDHEEEEEEEEVEEVPAVATPSTAEAPAAPLSKSARKRLARLASKTAENANAVVDAAKEIAVNAAESIPVPSTQQNGQATTSESALTSTEEEPIVPPSALKEESKINGVQEPAPSASIPSENKEEEASRPLLPNEKPSSSSTSDKSFLVPSSINFHPTLPETLPGKTGDKLPSNRKRKQPQDFEPSGPGNTPTPTSPSKLGVKFEDGVAPGEGKEGEKTITSPPKPVVKKDRNVIERTTWTFIMIGGFIGLLCMGHPYMILLVMLCQTLVYKEVTALFDLRDHGANQVDVAAGEKGDKWSKTLNWYFFVVCNYFLYGESIIYYFKHIVFVDAYMIPFARNHRFISFMLYVVGFVGFVANLQRQYLRQQFALFCWVHISLLLIVVSSHFIVNNILEGLVWFFVPASLVICNDVMAYVCGKLFGRTPLIKLSPKKTVEGFVGAFICTLLFGLAWGTFFMRFPYMICPARDLGTNVLSQVTCRPNPVFVWQDFEFTGPARQILSTILGHEPPSIPYAPFQIHVLVMATFASLVAPFGGFFASGFKRAFNIKDFGHSIPGHGGMTDRMDCQFMMGLFSYVYYSSLIRIQYVTVGSIMQTVVTSLTAGEQLELLADLKRFLEGQGVKA
ncbi:phosphatidate cytidylyltransferase [Kwoniella mangroviensis CBS 10435]|uniref:Phosphatidate cytidylyltransferase n=1 Tax=Kwoniella mangroviensis CBS 10435 TaxID=1331196 RepID=A0A1B9IU01_9TREE|nr:phosphatidate cytidylyltransferase [Kwoniella mangroviensis CBS 10435]